MDTISTLREALTRLEYPATRDDVMRLIRRDGADSRMAAWLETLPEGSYGGAWAICQALAEQPAPGSAASRVESGSKQLALAG
ncbi:DUF2795 domain-containing protein [Homoserinimonas hongtaonis]|uniref:DUF2795 domain-containing protein n=1 Tax=Homoserinimonas hongtaonis TaxID=2079791 RepID=UPI000D362198|nr:DUF2795 domain-containing protein [Salinibacterium hongtaonis]AWB89691.1 hypothetical protein C2138_09180 [Salinibacterium hongtaonis]